MSEESSSISEESGSMDHLSEETGMNIIEEQLTQRKFKRDLATAVNKNSMENLCNLPDYVIAEHLVRCFNALCETMHSAERRS